MNHPYIDRSVPARPVYPTGNIRYRYAVYTVREHWFSTKTEYQIFDRWEREWLSVGWERLTFDSYEDARQHVDTLVRAGVE